MLEKRINNSLKLSSIILGSCYFGTEISEEESFKMLDKYYELGGRTIDTARVYASWLEGGESASEKTIGKWLKSRNLQEEMTVVTKGGHPPIGDMLRSRLDRDSIFYDIEKSLSQW
jgi:aryl-alcohol dehydrogenase-like predicted oxidoreductase